MRDKGLTGAENTKGFILTEIYNRQKEMEKCGCPFGQITRERTDFNGKRIEGLVVNLQAFVEMHRDQIKSQTYMTFAVIVLALATGGNLVWNILKAFKVVP
jgi:hypothetical protein